MIGAAVIYVNIYLTRTFSELNLLPVGLLRAHKGLPITFLETCKYCVHTVKKQNIELSNRLKKMEKYNLFNFFQIRSIGTMIHLSKLF